MTKRKRDEWEIRGDARTLAEANEIMADKERHAEAVKMAQRMADDDAKRANAMKKVAGMKTTSNSVTGNTSRVNEAFFSSINMARR